MKPRDIETWRERRRRKRVVRKFLAALPTLAREIDVFATDDSPLIADFGGSNA